MTTTPLATDLALWSSLRTRRHHPQHLKGMDAIAGRWITRLRHARQGMRFLKRHTRRVVEQAPAWENMSDVQLDEQVAKLRAIFTCRRHTADQVDAALAATREIARRELGEYPYPVQIMGALGLFHGQIIEMVTGEGKTLTAALGATLLGWMGRPMHIITVNDYLAQRDAKRLQPFYQRCKLACGSIVHNTSETQRATLYRQSIVYLTQKELVADWLRDQLRLGRMMNPVSARWRQFGQPSHSRPLPPILIPGLFVAIVDELDAVLIDEAITPLIIAQSRGNHSQEALYTQARDMAMQLQPHKHYRVDLRKKQVRLTETGRNALALQLDQKDHAFWRSPRRREELIEQALVAEHCYRLAEHYQIVENKIVIVDEYTGRFMEDRQWQHGLHQAIEAKHHLQVTEDKDTLASLSFQRFFKQYAHLCGMTGTAAEAIGELEATYSLPVRILPTHRPLRRHRWPDLIFTRSEDRWRAVIQEIEEVHRMGRPVLVATRSVDASEKLSAMLDAHQLTHEVLNAVHHETEAAIIRQAGQHTAITVATNMAGRGTDIKPDQRAIQSGGLHVILTERHTARRIDRQLYGRAGRQGDPGSARNILSLEDDLLIKFAPRLAAALRTRFATRTTPLPRWTRFVFDRAQKKAQRQAFQTRARVLRHDEELDRSLPR